MQYAGMSAAPQANQTFVLHKGNATDATYSLEAASKPGSFLSVHPPTDAQPEQTIQLGRTSTDFAFEPAQGSYPKGSMLLNSPERPYILSPLANIVDEKYTAYFEFGTVPALPAPPPPARPPTPVYPHSPPAPGMPGHRDSGSTSAAAVAGETSCILSTTW